MRKALASSNYHALFQLYLNSVNMSAYLMDKFVERERVAALITMCRAYRPSLELSFIAKELGFLCDDECRTFIDGMVTVDIGSDDDEEVARKKQRRAALPLYTDKKRMTLDTKAAVPFLVHQLTEK